MTLSRRDFLKTGALAFLVKLCPAEILTGESAKLTKEIILTPLWETRINFLVCSALDSMRAYHQAWRNGSESAEITKVLYDLPTTDHITYLYNNAIGSHRSLRSDIPSVQEKALAAFKKWREFLNSAVAEECPGAQITEVIFNDAALKQVCAKVADNLAINLNDFSIVKAPDIENIARTFLTGSERDVINFCQPFAKRAALYLNNADVIAGKEYARDTALRQLLGHENRIRYEEIGDQLKIEGNVVGAVPRLRPFMSRHDAYLVTGVDIVVENDGTKSLIPAKNWFLIFEKIREGFKDKWFGLTDEVNIVGKEAAQKSVIIRVKTDSEAAKYFQEIVRGQSSCKSMMTR